jgi:hypothetical protein
MGITCEELSIGHSVNAFESELYQNGYRYIRPLGAGGFAKVVLAEILPEKLAPFKADADLTGNPCVQSVR